MINKASLCLVFIISLIYGGGCASFSSPEPVGLSTTSPNEDISSFPTGTGVQETQAMSASLISNVIAAVIAHPNDYAGREVEIVGYYRGWDLLKEVQGTSPVTRSDWVIADNSGAIYVTGIAPQNLNPASQQDTKTLIRLAAIVEQNQNGVYLRGTSVEIIFTE